MAQENESKLLIVEGTGDKEFFEKLLQQSECTNVTVTIKTSSQIGGNKDTKKETLKMLKDKMRKFGQYTHLGAVIDTDYLIDGHSVENSLNRFYNDIKDMYDIIEPYCTGYYFRSSIHPSLPKVGLWFMPNNKDEGALEDWFIKIAKTDEESLVKYAQEVCNNAVGVIDKIESKRKILDKFKKPQNIRKAQVGIWTSLQETPHLGTENIIFHHLYDENLDDFKNFIDWLKFIYD